MTKLLYAWLATALAFSTFISPSIAGPTAVFSNTQYSAHPWKPQADWMKHHKRKKDKNAGEQGQTAAQQNVQSKENGAGNEPASSVAADTSAQDKSAVKDVAATGSSDAQQISNTNSGLSK